MCVNSSCPSREMCARVTSDPTPLWQSYACFSFPQGSTKCQDFIPDEKAQMWSILSRPVRPPSITVDMDANSFYPGIMTNLCSGVHPVYLDNYMVDKKPKVV